MAFPKLLAAHLTTYLVKNWALRKKCFPLVLMLEPTERCNLACSGCGRIREYHDSLDQSLTIDQCLRAVEEVGAPTVILTGGEPLLHPDIEAIAAGILTRRKHLHICTNGILLEKSLGKFRPGSYMNFVLHIDGLAETHDRGTGRDGVFNTVINAIKAAKDAGFRVYTNTTVFKKTDFAEIKALFDVLTGIGVDAFMISPAFDFATVSGSMFLSRDEIARVFRPLEQLRRRFRFYNTSAYLDFLLGGKQVDCMPWSTPTLTPKGWRRPCYLLADEPCGSYRELMQTTDWEKYGAGRDRRCANCMVHSGFEAALIDQARRSLPELFKLAGR